MEKLACASGEGGDISIVLSRRWVLNYYILCMYHEMDKRFDCMSPYFKNGYKRKLKKPCTEHPKPTLKFYKKFH